MGCKKKVDRPYVALSLFSTVLVVFCILFAFPQPEGKVILNYYELTAINPGLLTFMTSASNITILMLTLQYLNSLHQLITLQQWCYRATAKTEFQRWQRACFFGT